MKHIKVLLLLLIPFVSVSQSKILKGDFDGNGKVEYMRTGLIHGYYHILLCDDKEITPLIALATNDVQFCYVGNINGKKGDEVFIFQRPEIGYHGRVDVYTLIKNAWVKIKHWDFISEMDVQSLARSL